MKMLAALSLAFVFSNAFAAPAVEADVQTEGIREILEACIIAGFLHFQIDISVNLDILTPWTYSKYSKPSQTGLDLKS